MAGYLGLFRCLLRTSLLNTVCCNSAHCWAKNNRLGNNRSLSSSKEQLKRESDGRITAKSEGADKVYLVFLGCERVPFSVKASRGLLSVN